MKHPLSPLLTLPVLITALIQTADADNFYPSYRAYNGGLGGSVVAIADLNNDKRSDIVSGLSGNQILIQYQNTADSLNPPVHYLVFGTPKTIKIADVNNDRRPDIVLGYSLQKIEILTQTPAGDFASSQLIATPLDYLVETGNFTGDSLTDIAGIGWGDKKVNVFRQTTGAFALDNSYAANYAGYNDIAVGDVNNDGRADVIVTSGQLYSSDDMSILLQTANGTFAPAIPVNLPGTTDMIAGVAVGDVTGDNLQDIIVSHGGNRPYSFISVLVQKPSGVFDSIVNYPSHDCPEPVTLGDVNRDGRTDVFVAHGGWSKVGVYVQNPDGSLAAEQLFGIPYASRYIAQGLAVGDVNSDGSDDIAIADYNNGTVVLTNALSRIFASFTASTVEGDAPLTVYFNASTSNTPGNSSLVYSWYFNNGTTASGETATCTFTRGGEYAVQLVVENSFGEKDTATQLIHVNQPNTAPVFETPADIRCIVNRTVSFLLHAADAENQVLTFRASGIPADAVFDTANGQFIWTPQSTGTFGPFTFIVTDGMLEDTTSCSIIVEYALPVITAFSGSLTVQEGQRALFTAAATGDMLSYQWQKNGVAIPGATLAEYAIALCTKSDSGAVFRCVVSNPAGSVATANGILSVKANPVYPEWNPNQYWFTYKLGDMRTNKGKVWKCINVAYSYIEPSSTYGRYGWKLVS